MTRRAVATSALRFHAPLAQQFGSTRTLQTSEEVLRTGQKTLRKMRKGHLIASYYPPRFEEVPGMHEFLQAEPGYILQQQKLAIRARKGKGTKKKGEGRGKKKK